MIQYPENKGHIVKTAIQVSGIYEMTLAKVQALHTHSWTTYI